MNETYTDILARRARQVQRGGARAAVLGVNDGLVSTLCIVLAVAAAGADAKGVLLAGFAGLVAGAISMAAGEWISVKAQVELFDGILSDIHKLVGRHKDFLVEQLAEGLVATGNEKATAHAAAKEIARDEKQLGDAYARHVMGFNPDELGSPWLAAVSSFVLFTVGALVPLSVWFFGSGMAAVVLSIVLTAIAALVVGGYIANSSGKRLSVGALRQLGIILLASAVTYGVGYLFGVTVG